MRKRCTLMPVRPTTSARARRSKSSGSTFSSRRVTRWPGGVRAASRGGTVKTPLVVKAGGVEVVTLSAQLNAEDAEIRSASTDGIFLGIRVATMNSDGNLYLLEHAVAHLLVNQEGRIQRAEPAIHQTLRGFEDLQVAPPGDRLQANKKTPFVWADSHT